MLAPRLQTVEAQLPLTTVQTHGLGPTVCGELGHDRGAHRGLLGRHLQASSTAEYPAEAALPTFGNLQGTEAEFVQHQGDVRLKGRQRSVQPPPRRYATIQWRTDQGGEASEFQRFEFKAAPKLTGLNPPLRHLKRQASLGPQHRAGEAIQHQSRIICGPSGLE